MSKRAHPLSTLPCVCTILPPTGRSDNNGFRELDQPRQDKSERRRRAIGHRRSRACKISSTDQPSAAGKSILRGCHHCGLFHQMQTQARFVVKRQDILRRIVFMPTPIHGTAALHHSARRARFFHPIMLCHDSSASCLAVAWQSPLDSPTSLKASLIDVLDAIFLIIFTAEMLVKMVAYGLIHSSGAYLRR